MAYVLDQREKVTREVRRVTRERLDEAISMLSDLDESSADEIEDAIHGVRKRCKEVRAAARLVRSALGDDFDRFNREVRGAADLLAPIRDAHALLGTFDDLRATQMATNDAELEVVRVAQAAVAETATRGVIGSDPRIADARALLVSSRKQIKHWKIPDGFDTLGVGMEDTYRRGGRALRRARDRPTDDRMHEWRKSVKHLWYQVRLIERAAPSVLGALVTALDDLAEALGDDHDLAVLVERLAAHPEAFGGKQAAKRARRLARSQQADLRRRAFRLGATVYAETPGAFTRRMGAYWERTAELGPELATGGIAELAHEEQRTARGSEQLDPAHVIERERKYLVTRVPELPEPGVALRQGYLAIDGAVSVRVRDAGDDGATLTLKAGRGAVRTELEWSLTGEQFAAAWEQTRGRRISKTRHCLPSEGHLVELDIFHDDLDGLVVAEVEFDSDDALAAFRPPDWFGPEVTDDETYTNASLAANAPRGTPSRRPASHPPPQEAGLPAVAPDRHR